MALLKFRTKTINFGEVHRRKAIKPDMFAKSGYFANFWQDDVKAAFQLQLSHGDSFLAKCCSYHERQQNTNISIFVPLDYMKV